MYKGLWLLLYREGATSCRACISLDLTCQVSHLKPPLNCSHRLVIWTVECCCSAYTLLGALLRQQLESISPQDSFGQTKHPSLSLFTC
jgi:hypothetical protein